MKTVRDGNQMPRRSFFNLFWGFCGLIAAFELIGVALAFLRPLPSKPLGETAEALVVAGRTGSFQPGSVTPFVRGKFYLACLNDGGFLALSRKCPHLGCTVPWNAETGRFACPCHGSAFDIAGDVLQAPAPRPLDLFPIRIENGVIRVDTSRPLKRSGFTSEQVAYADSSQVLADTPHSRGRPSTF